MPDEIRLWFWSITDPLTKRRRKTTYRMTEQEALARFGTGAVKIEDSLEIRKPGTMGPPGDFMRKARF